MAELLDLSIVVPAYNAESTIRDTLESTLPLLAAGAECIVVDDGSVDATAGIVKSIAATNSGIILVKQSNTGLSGARNRGVQNASRSWITFLDADDQIVPLGIIRAISSATMSNLDIGKSRIDQVVAGSNSFGESAGESRSSDEPLDQRTATMESWLLNGWGGLLGCTFRRSLLQRLDPCFVTVPFGEDLVFTFAIAGLVEDYAITDEVGYRYLVGSQGQMTAPENPLRLSITGAFRACEELAQSGPPRRRYLLWILTQKYRWSRAPHVSPRMRVPYRRSIAQYCRGMRRRLGLSRTDLVVETLRLGRDLLSRRPQSSKA